MTNRGRVNGELGEVVVVLSRTWIDSQVRVAGSTKGRGAEEKQEEYRRSRAPGSYKPKESEFFDQRTAGRRERKMVVWRGRGSSASTDVGGDSSLTCKLGPRPASDITRLPPFLFLDHGCCTFEWLKIE